jgi:hypothetical protein
MPGSMWTLEELLCLVLIHRSNYYRDSAVQVEMGRRGIERSLESIRSKLSELRKLDDLFDRGTWKWKDEGVDWMMEEIRRRELGNDDDDDDEDEDDDDENDKE